MTTSETDKAAEQPVPTKRPEPLPDPAAEARQRVADEWRAQHPGRAV